MKATKSEPYNLLHTIISLLIICVFFGFGFRNPEFDVELMKNVFPLFIGTKDFRTFMAKPQLNPE